MHCSFSSWFVACVCVDSLAMSMETFRIARLGPVLPRLYWLPPLSRKSAFQKALPADIAALEADAFPGAFLLKATLAEAPLALVARQHRAAE